MVNTGTASGSGILLYSAHRQGKREDHILTNFHVIDSAIEIVEESDSDEGKEVKKGTHDSV